MFAKQETTYCCICGSDQVWNTIALYLAPVKFLQFVPYDKRIAYAPSFGENMIPASLRKILTKYLSSIPEISIRENSGSMIIKNLIGIDVPVVLDPVFLLTNRNIRLIN